MTKIMLSHAERKRLYFEEFDKWEQATENFKDFGLKKCLCLSHKYRVDTPGLVAIAKKRK